MSKVVSEREWQRWQPSLSPYVKVIGIIIIWIRCQHCHSLSLAWSACLGGRLDLLMTAARTRSHRGYKFVIPSKTRMGRLRVAVRRAFILANGKPICIGDVLRFAYPRFKRVPNGYRWSVRQALLRDAEIVGRMRVGRGRPNLWVPKAV